MHLELTRTYYPGATNGSLKYNDRFQCYTIERPWLENKSFDSCIPEGTYRLLTTYSREHGPHFMLQDGKDRALILIHPATNAAEQLPGCIAPVTILTGEGKGIASRLAFERV